MITTDEIVCAVMNEDWEYAVALIQAIQQERKTLLLHRLEFDLTPPEVHYERTTDFLPFQGWEAA